MQNLISNHKHLFYSFSALQCQFDYAYPERHLHHLNKNCLKEQLYIASGSVPDQKGPQTPGMNNFVLDTAIWHVEVPHTSTIRLLIASSSTFKHAGTIRQ